MNDVSSNKYRYLVNFLKENPALQREEANALNEENIVA